MAPTPQETMSEEKTIPSPLKRPLSGEEVVISGMSGIFPSSDSVQEFMENLYNKVDMVTSENPRWVFNHPEVPKHLGKVNGMGKFDAQFFRVHYKQAFTMEPMSRKLLEHAYGAIYDSGINPLQLRGKKVGVFIGSTFSESEKIVIYENVQRNGFGITGCNKAMYANRISYWIDGKGPSYALDLACASSMACLEHAYRSISSGQCDAAIVGGCNLCMHPNVSLHCRRAGFICLDGKTKCFDKNGEGYVRSDAISVLFLQKAKDAKRIYSEVYHAKTSYSPESKQLLPVREPEQLRQFLEAFYSEIDVSPEDVEYIEANGSAFPEADINELKAIGQVFAKKKPIKVGCVKSNMGSSEPASGVCGLTKVCLAYHNGQLPGNLHYKDPLEIPELKEDKIQVLTDNANFGRGFAALNSFSYSGANVHVLLKGHYKQKDAEAYKSSIPHLVLVSGRQEDCVKKILSNLKKMPIDPEQIGLLDNIHEFNIPGHMNRGFSLLETNEKKETICLSQSVEYCPGNIRPLWFVYSGMGSQWATMGAELMRIPIFAAAIQKCHRVLEPKNIDIIRILTDPDKTIYDNIVHSFVGIAAVQIGLTDILKEMGIIPDNIIGHSVGELGCAYADGCFTAEEMILSAYSRGLVSVQTPFIRGSMAAVGMGYKEILPICPPEIEVACHNSSESSTISGPADIMKQFVAELTTKGVFAKEVPCSNIAYHSRYIAEAGPGLLKYLSEVITNPKPRSKKWVSTSVPQEKWNDAIAKYSSAEYHTNNLLNPVLFEETSKLIPSDAIVIEIAPHGLLQAILKRDLSECVHVPLTRRGTADPVKFLLEAVGKLYQAGLNLKVDVLYPKIQYPVSTCTPFLSQYVEWEHSEDWAQAKYNNKDRKVATVRDFVMSIHDDDFKYFTGHVRDGNYTFPESAFLVLIWETLAMYKGVNYKNMSVVFEDVKFHCEAIIKPDLPLRFQIMILKGNNSFEVTYEDSTIVSGFVSEYKHADRIQRNLPESVCKAEDVLLSSKDIYTIMKLRGYAYKDEFQSIYSSTSNRNKASIKWTDNWITFLDSLLQFNSFAREFDGVSVPILIKKLGINIDMQRNAEKVVIDDIACLSADLYSLYEHTKCGGVEFDGIVYEDKLVVEKKPDVMLTQTFVPHFITGNVELKTALQVNLQIVSENVTENNVKVVELVSSRQIDIAKTIKEVVTEIPCHEFIVESVKKDQVLIKKYLKGTNVLVIDNLLADEQKMNAIRSSLPNNAFILALEQNTTRIHPQYKLFSIITATSIHNQMLILLRKVDTNSDKNITYMPIVYDRKFSWIATLQTELEKSRKVVLISERQPFCGLLGMVRKLRKDYGTKIELLIIDDYTIPSFNPENSFFRKQLDKNLACNILHKSQWGGYYFINNTHSVKLQNIHLISTIPGDLDSLSWIEKPSPIYNNRTIQVCYTGPSYKDAMIAAGHKVNNDDHAFGMDFSGINSRGEKVMGVVSGGAIASTVEADLDLLWPVPEYWTLEDAATVPLAYVHAYYCLAVKTRLRRGRTVFVHGGAGVLGQAVITICLSLDCNVFTTVSDVKTKEFLLNMFPTLKEEHISQSSEIMFQDMILTKTQKRCDVVINCLSGSLRKAAMKCVGPQSYFLDISEHDMVKNDNFEMYFLNEIKDYIAVHLNTIFKPEFAKEKKMLQLMICDGIAKGIVKPLSRVMLQLLICDGIAKGIVKPLSRVVYSPSNVTKAFRLLAASKNRGKVLIGVQCPETVDRGLSANFRISYSSKGSYVVVCDETAVGIELADRLVRHGARKLVIQMKPNSFAGYCYTKFLSWNKLKVSAKISSENLQTEKGCVKLLKEAAQLGPILGIFIVQKFCSDSESWSPEDVSKKFNNSACVVANLDLISRTVHNELDHFVVLNSSDQKVTDEYMSSITDKICRARNEINLPALVLRVGQLRELDDSENFQSKMQPLPLTAMFNALETSLKLKHQNVMAFNLKKDVTSEFIQRIQRIIGVKNISEIDEKLTLKDLLLNESNIIEVNTAIKEAYQISYPAEKLQKMTIGNLTGLEKGLSKGISSVDSGLDVFFTYIDEDECSAAEPLVTMATTYSSVKEEEDLDPKATYLMLVPGFEGHHQIFTTVCERLKVQAMTFQLVPEMTNDNIPQMAANIAKFMKKRLELKTKFYLLGYSFGVNIALELARLFEKEGHVGVVYCLDSSPDALRAQLDAYLGNLTDIQLQNTIVEHMFKLMAGRDSTELKLELQTKDNWNDKIELCVHKLRGLVKYSHQYKRCILQGAYRRIMLAREYEPDFVLNSELVLMRGIQHAKTKELPNDYNLSKYTNKPIKVFDIESDHASATQDCRVSNIVNRLLEPKLLEEFKNKNLCWSYLADPIKTW